MTRLTGLDAGAVVAMWRLGVGPRGIAARLGVATRAVRAALVAAGVYKPAYLGPCRYCGRRVGSQHRGLCYPCRSDPVAIAATPPFRDTRPAAAVAGNDRPEPPRHPAAPCPHPPESAGRVETYRARAAAGEFLYHPADAGFEEVLP